MNYWSYSGILLVLKMYFRKLKKRKGKPNLSNWAEPEGPTQDRADPVVGPRGAHLGPTARQQGTMAAAAGPLGVRARDSSASAPI
jgi:hypothetical protein